MIIMTNLIGGKIIKDYNVTYDVVCKQSKGTISLEVVSFFFLGNNE